MYKTISILKRNPQLSPQEFRDLYENVYASKIVELGMGEFMVDYRRNYVDRVNRNPGAPQTEIADNEFPYDCITETWFRDEKAFKQTVAFSAAQFAKGTAPDVDKLQSFMRTYSVAECRTTMPLSDIEPAFKNIALFKRNHSLTSKEFRDMYENDYAPIAVGASSNMGKYLLDYRRNYIEGPLHDPRIPQTATQAGEFPYDALVAFWFRDEQAFNDAVAEGAAYDAKNGSLDPHKLWSSRSVYIVKEYRTVFPGRS